MTGSITMTPRSSSLRRWIARLVLSVALTAVAATAARAVTRVALVLGVSNYQNVPRLAHPDGDAAAFGDVLRQIGFDSVMLRQDVGVSEMRRAVREFAAVAAGADMAVVYYAGHGIEVDGTNFLIPADARLRSDFDVEDETVSLDRILQAINPAKRLRLVILDACRDNPFADKMARGVATRSMGRGLAQVEPAMPDTLIAYAAKAGAVADDGNAIHSPFSAALLNHIATPGLDLRLALGRVRDEVLKSTGRRQEPFVYGSLGGDTVALVPPLAPAVDPGIQVRRDYESAAAVGTQQAWTAFLAAHGSGLYADFARAALGKLEAAQQASANADAIRREAEDLARRKTEDLKRQIEDQAARQTEQAKLQISEQAKRDLEQERQRIADQARRELDEASQRLAEARRQADAAAAEVDEVKKRAALDAQREIEAAKRDAERMTLAALTPPAETPPVPSSPTMDPADIARLLQAHLRRVGCDPGGDDGAWSAASQNALDSFNRNAGTRFDVRVASLDALDAVRARSGRICPLVCPRGQRAVDDRCVAITCEANFAPDADGVCRRRPEPPPKAKTVSRAPGAASRYESGRRTPSARGGDPCAGDCEGD